MQFDGGGGRQVEHPRVPGIGLVLPVAELGEDGLDLGDVVGAAGDDEAGVLGVGDDLGVGGVAGLTVLPPVLVELLDEGLEAGEFLGAGEGKELGLGAAVRPGRPGAR